MVLNIKVATKQGINFQVHTIRIPLFLKLLNFFDRHYNYKYLVRTIVDHKDDQQAQVMDLFVWTYQNISIQPESLPVIDDHVWHTIVRGYGVCDQFSDVFTTLCNYAGIDAFFRWAYNRERTKRTSFSFVRIEQKWRVFDPYYGIYFKNENGQIADIEELKFGGAWTIESLDGRKPDIDYTVYLPGLPSIKEMGLTRANIQSPLNRLLFLLKSWSLGMRHEGGTNLEYF